MATRQINGTGLELDLTETEGKMYDLFTSKPDVPCEELHKCLWFEDGERSNIKFHISNLRKKLQTVGQDVFFRAGRYWLVRQMPTAHADKSILTSV